jgi:uncharacterized repeat protein (TIGR04076 family)
MESTTSHKVRITVIKKTHNTDFIELYAEKGLDWTAKNCCHSFEEGQEFITDGHMPEGFSDWAWADMQKYVMVLARGGDMLGVKPGTYVTSCSDGFRPVFYLLERIED